VQEPFRRYLIQGIHLWFPRHGRGHLISLGLGLGFLLRRLRGLALWPGPLSLPASSLLLTPLPPPLNFQPLCPIIETSLYATGSSMHNFNRTSRIEYASKSTFKRLGG